ncbi:MAG TPA: ribonuclease E/G [Acidiphilium sp.]|nr:MAG: ribonuclease G [Acidiphilium sp. 21-60-14]OYV89577.1 MAG: ribonuclease G [Acidiphilium sp. 37-60-79]OZB39125.1 MAG: ribonuclease G [Acidiphilium sp. 34-60-192]HQT88744.1 ribonuclease E/G [Acidiphilium sp.]HQU23893.1 ribonuclease E/G [Acidiphilium sp.]
MNDALILASATGNLLRLALLEAGTLVEYTLIDPAQPDGVGDQYEGRVLARASAMGGVFVDLGSSTGTGFLPDSAGGKTATEGDALSLRITRAAQGGKGPRVATTSIPPQGGKPGLRARGPGPLGALRALHPHAPIHADQYAVLATLRPTYPDATYQAACFAALEDEIAALAEPQCPLPGGAIAHFSPTPALTAIDIDAAAATAARARKTESQAQLNRGLIPELTRQIRLRNFGGAILIDFAGMKATARPALGPDLATALARDPQHPKLLGFTALGFAEIRRPRIRAPLHEILAHHHTTHHHTTQHHEARQP